MHRWTICFLVACGSNPGPGGPDGPPAPGVDAAREPDARPTGCGQATTLLPGQTIARAMQRDGRTRTYGIRLPSGYTGGPVPLVVALHGGGGSGEQMEAAQAALDPIADREGFALVYPDGIPRTPDSTGPLALRTWNAGACCGTAVEEAVDDVGFLTAVMDDVEASACIDPARVFITGISNGGMMAYRMACERADRVAAIAPVAASLVVPCAPSRPVPLFHVHGDADARVPYAGGTGCGLAEVETRPIPEIVATWAGWNGCTGDPIEVFAQGNGTCVRSGTTCTADTVLCTIAGGSHSWPGAADDHSSDSCPGGELSTSFFASEAIWAFFAAQAP